MASPRVRSAPYERDAPRPRGARRRLSAGAATDYGTTSKIADRDRKLAQYRAALDAGANPATVAPWIAETEAEKASYTLVTSRPKPRLRMTEQEIRSIVDKFADIARVLIDADPDDKAEIFRKLGLKLSYHPGRQLVTAQIEAPLHWYSESVRGGTRHLRACLRLSVSWCWGRGGERADGSPDQAHHDLLRRDARTDRRDGLLLAHAPGM